MSRKVLIVLLAAIAAFTMTACTRRGEEEDTTTAADTYESPIADTETEVDSSGVSISDMQVADTTTEAPYSSNYSSQSEVAEENDNETVEDTDEDISLQESDEATYTVKILTYEKNDKVDIRYPVISGWEDEVSQNKWNEKFKNFAIKESKRAGKGRVKTVWKIKHIDANVLSIVVKYSEKLKGTKRRYRYCDTFNINMKNGKKKHLKGIANISDITNALIESQGYSVSDENMTIADVLYYQTDSMSLPSESQMKFDLEGFDYNRTTLFKAGGHTFFGQSFLNESGNVVLVLEVPQSQGGFVWVTID